MAILTLMLLQLTGTLQHFLSESSRLAVRSQPTFSASIRGSQQQLSRKLLPIGELLGRGLHWQQATHSVAA